MSEDTFKNKINELESFLYNQKRGVIYKAVIETIEKPLIERALERSEGNQLKAARILGINRNTIRSKIKKYGIDCGMYKQ
jgi:DNA-binding protein Fis